MKSSQAFFNIFRRITFGDPVFLQSIPEGSKIQAQQAGSLFLDSFGPLQGLQKKVLFHISDEVLKIHSLIGKLGWQGFP